MVRRPARSALTPALLLQAYHGGFFPMAEHRSGPIAWYSPDPRAVLPLSGFRVSRSLRRVVRLGQFDIRWDTSFEEVMRGCADRDDTWISEELIRVYVALHSMGYGHSVEAWQGDVLQGGLYGVAIGGAFFGESMFSRVPNASKAALVALVHRLRERGFSLLDVQFLTPHLERLGAREIPRAEYLALLDGAICRKTSFLSDGEHTDSAV